MTQRDRIIISLEILLLVGGLIASGAKAATKEGFVCVDPGTNARLIWLRETDKVAEKRPSGRKVFEMEVVSGEHKFGGKGYADSKRLYLVAHDSTYGEVRLSATPSEGKTSFNTLSLLGEFRLVDCYSETKKKPNSQ